MKIPPKEIFLILCVFGVDSKLRELRNPRFKLVYRFAKLIGTYWGIPERVREGWFEKERHCLAAPRFRIA